MNPNKPAEVAAYLKSVREQIDRIRYSQSGGRPINIAQICLNLVNDLRKKEAICTAAVVQAEIQRDAAPVVRDLHQALDRAEASVMGSLPTPKPVEAPPPQRNKGGRPRKNPIPAEPGGLA